MEHQTVTKTDKSVSQNEKQSDVKSTSPKNESIHPIHHLQNTIGNRALGYLIQRKRKYDQSDKIFEYESDHITGVPGDVATILSETTTEKGIENSQPATESIMFKASGDNAGISTNPQAIQSQLGHGHPLESGISQRAASSFGQDFSHVQVHTDAQSAELSKHLNARAFTVGEHVAFGSSEYKPGTMIGDALIAHELAHVVQQSSANTSRTIQQSGTEYNALEEDADLTAIGAIVSSWGKTKETLANINHNAIPRLKSGLRLQRCISDTNMESLSESEKAEAEERRKFESIMWQKTVQKQFGTDIAKQSNDISQDILAFEKYATGIRVEASKMGPDLISNDLFIAWDAAQRDVISLGAYIKNGNADQATLKTTKEDLEKFYKTFRNAISPLDTTGSVGGWPTAKNPYLNFITADQFIKNLNDANTYPQWLQVFSDYRIVVEAMDNYIGNNLRKKGKKDEAESLELIGGRAVHLDELLQKHPDAKKIQAVFYTEEQSKDVFEPGFELKGIPLYFYLYREDDKWTLADLTSPHQAKANTSSKGTIESPEINALFGQLNTKLRFPKGMLYWHMPDGKYWSLNTTAEWSFSEWLTWIGIGVAVIGLALATAGASLPATAFFIGSGIIGAVAGGVSIAEKAEQGMLTEKDIIIETASIIGNLFGAATAGLGKIVVSGAMKTGSAARLAVLADRLYCPALGVTLAANSVTLITVTDRAWDDYKAIDKSTIPQSEKDLAKARLVGQFLLTGGIILLSMKGDIASFTKGRNLYLDLDFTNEPIARPLPSTEELIASGKSFPNPSHLEDVLKRTDLPEDTLLRIKADLNQAISSGKIPSDSLQGIISDLRSANTLDRVNQVLAELRYANRLIYTNAASAESKIITNATKGNSYELKTGKKVEIDPVNEADALYIGNDAKTHLDEVKNTPLALRQKLARTPEQLENLKNWRKKDPLNREVAVVVETDKNWTELLGLSKSAGETKAAMMNLIDSNVPLNIGNYKLSVTKMRELWNATVKKAKEMNMFPPNENFFNNMPTLKDAETFLGIKLQ